MLLILMCIIVVALFTILFLWMRHQMCYWQRRGIAHRRPEFFYGNLKGVMETKHFGDIFREAYVEFKNTGQLFAGFYMLFDAAVLILNLDLAKAILIRDFQHFSERGFFYNERDDPLTAHIFSLPSNEWRLLRSKLSPAFTGGKLKLMFPTVKLVGERLIATMENQIDEGSFILELKDLYDRFTTDVIGISIFGLECNSLQDPNTEFRCMNQKLFDNPRNHRAIDGLLYAFPRLARFLRLKQIPDATSEFYFRIVKETLSYRRKHNIKRNDLMNMLMELLDDGALTLNEIVANAFLFFFAGFETSSTTMTMALYELARNPIYQERVRLEIKHQLVHFSGEFSYECAQSLPYLDQVINETLRKHTIIPQLQRTALCNYNTSDPKYYISKGTIVLIPIDAIHHDPTVYPEPEKFLPERFSADAIKQRHPMAWLPFGEGPRNCIGASMGRMQMRVGLVSLLRRYKFSVVDQTPEKLDYYLQCPFLIPKHGIFLGVARIQ